MESYGAEPRVATAKGMLEIRSHSAVAKAVAALWDQPELGDVVLRVGPDEEQLRCHRCILAARSDVFRALFFPAIPFKDSNLPEVAFRSVDPAVFKIVLRFMYSGEATIGGGDAVAVMCTADFLGVQELKDHCGAFLATSVSDSNVWDVLRQAAEHRVEKLLTSCVEVVREKFAQLVDQESFLLLPEDVLASVISSDRLNAPELEVFRAVNLWSQPEAHARRAVLEADAARRMAAERQAIITSTSNLTLGSGASAAGVGHVASATNGAGGTENAEEERAEGDSGWRAAANRMLQHVRLPLMSPAELSDVVEPTGLVPYEDLYRAVAVRHGSRRPYGSQSAKLRQRIFGERMVAVWDVPRLMQALAALEIPPDHSCFFFSSPRRNTVRRCFGARAPPLIIRCSQPLTSGRVTWRVRVDRCVHRFGQRLQLGIVTAGFEGASLSGFGASSDLASEFMSPENSSDDDDDQRIPPLQNAPGAASPQSAEPDLPAIVTAPSSRGPRAAARRGLSPHRPTSSSPRVLPKSPRPAAATPPAANASSSAGSGAAATSAAAAAGDWNRPAAGSRRSSATSDVQLPSMRPSSSAADAFGSTSSVGGLVARSPSAAAAAAAAVVAAVMAGTSVPTGVASPSNAASGVQAAAGPGSAAGDRSAGRTGRVLRRATLSSLGSIGSGAILQQAQVAHRVELVPETAAQSPDPVVQAPEAAECRAAQSWYVDSLSLTTGDVVVVTADLYSRRVTFVKRPSGRAPKRRVSVSTSPGEDDAGPALPVCSGTAALPDEPVYLAVSLLSNGNNSGSNQVGVTLLDPLDGESDGAAQSPHEFEF